MSEYSVLVLHVDKDKAALKKIQQQFTIYSRTYYRGANFVVKSATPGRELEQEVRQALLCYAVLSQDFVASRWVEALEKVQQLARLCGSQLVPISYRPCGWPVAGGPNYYEIPNGKPIATWKDKDAAWVEVSRMTINLLQDLYPRGL
jgi:hypothetical protein